MAKLIQIPQFAAPVWVAFQRIEHHSRPGGMLAGIKWNREGVLRTERSESLPSVQPLFVESQSVIFAGAPRDTAAGIDKSNTPVRSVLTLRLEIVVDRKYGFVRRDPTSLAERKGLLEWAGLVQDAIETSTHGKPDARLNRTLSEPVAFILREPEVGVLSFSAILEVTLKGRSLCRGERDYTFPDLG